MGENQLAVVERGRERGLELATLEGSVAMSTWASDILEGIRPLAELLDRHHGNDLYSYSLDHQAAKLADAALTPAILAALTLGAVFVAAALPSCFAWLAFGAAIQRFLKSERRLQQFNFAMGALLAASVLWIVF